MFAFIIRLSIILSIIYSIERYTHGQIPVNATNMGDISVNQNLSNDELFETPEIIIESSDPEFITVPRYHNLLSDCIYSDVLSHSKDNPFGNAHGRYTNVHETAHGIHSELRNQYRNNYNAFYCLKGQAVLLKNPNLKIRHVSKYIPSVLRSSRYKTYFINQLSDWDDVPTYILDEWNCYLLGAECAVDDHYRQRDLDHTDAVSGAFEFSIYSVALAMAIKDIDTEYWSSYPQFKKFIRYNLHRSSKAFETGSLVPAFRYKEQDRLQQALLNDPDAEPIRLFLKNEFDGIFLK